jgi:hypothetical protein
LHYEAISGHNKDEEDKEDVYDIEIIEILKGLLNYNVSNRPSFSLIIEKLVHIIGSYQFIKERSHQYINDFYFTIKNEGDYEISTNITHMSTLRLLSHSAQSTLPKKTSNNVNVDKYINKQTFIDFYKKKRLDIEDDRTTNGLLKIQYLGEIIPGRGNQSNIINYNYYSFEPLVDDELHYKLLNALKNIDVSDVEFTFLQTVKLNKSIFVSTILKKNFLDYIEVELAKEGYYRYNVNTEASKPCSLWKFTEFYLMFTLFTMILVSLGAVFSIYVRKYSIHEFDTSKFQLPIIIE